jgi:hypothetical protein
MTKLEVYKILNTGKSGCITSEMLVHLHISKKSYQAYLNLSDYFKDCYDKGSFVGISNEITEELKVRMNKTVSKFDKVRKRFFQGTIIDWDKMAVLLIDGLPENATRITEQQIIKFLKATSKPVTDLHEKRHLITEDTNIKH